MSNPGKTTAERGSDKTDKKSTEKKGFSARGAKFSIVIAAADGSREQDLIKVHGPAYAVLSRFTRPKEFCLLEELTLEVLNTNGQIAVFAKRVDIARSLQDLERRTLLTHRDLAQERVSDQLVAAEACDENDSDYLADLQALDEALFVKLPTDQISKLLSLERCGGPDCKQATQDSKLMKCSRCGTATYCSITCQKAAWPQHKKTCRKPVKPGDARFE